MRMVAEEYICSNSHEWQIPIEEVFQGYIAEGATFTCPICGEQSTGYRPVWVEEYVGQVESIEKRKKL